jgi:A/G-specific adenine glycosylase
MDYGAVYLTAKKTNIQSISKQSKFEGSDREVRGWIVKQLVHTSPVLTFQQIASEFPQKDVGKIVEGLVNEKILEIQEHFVILAK